MMPLVDVCAQTLTCLGLLLAGAVDGVTQPPPLEQMALSLTNYWFFDSAGAPVAYEGQADGDPSVYGSLYPTSAGHKWQVAGCIGGLKDSPWPAWTKTYLGPDAVSYTTAVSFLWYGERVTLVCADTFGLESYRRPFFHEGCGCWVVPVDILTDEPVKAFVWEWETTAVSFGEIDE